MKQPKHIEIWETV